MGLSWNEFVNPRGELRRREEAKQLAEQKAQNDAMAQAMGYGEQPTLSTISAMPALPARETSFQGDGSRFGMTGTDEDYQRLFGPAAQQQPSQLHQEMQRQQGGIPQDNSPAGRMIRNMVKSGNPTVVSKGLELAKQRIMNPPEPKSPPALNVQTAADGRQYWFDNQGNRQGPVSTDKEWEQALAQKQEEIRQKGLPQPTNPKELVDSEQKIRKEYQAAIKAPTDALISAQQAFSMLDQANATGDYGGVIQFLKTLDPGSVVRESETEAFTAAQGFFKGLKARLNGLQGKGALTPDIRADIKQSIAGITKVWEEDYNREHGKYTKLAGAYGDYMDPERVVGPAVSFANVLMEDPIADPLAEPVPGGPAPYAGNDRRRGGKTASPANDPLGIR